MRKKSTLVDYSISANLPNLIKRARIQFSSKTILQVEALIKNNIAPTFVILEKMNLKKLPPAYFPKFSPIVHFRPIKIAEKDHRFWEINNRILDDRGYLVLYGIKIFK